MRRIGVLTTGGDAPGMNAAIRGVIRSASSRNVEVMGIFRGWWGLINEELKTLDHRAVSGIVNLGGTVLKTMRCTEFKTDEGKARAFATVEKHGIEGLIVIGGNGSIEAAHSFYLTHNVPFVAVAATIDNDVNGIDMTIGADTAINTALAALDNIRDTATSMERVFVVEVMGRDSGYIALQVALAGGCEDAIIPEQPCDFDALCHNIVNGNIRGKVSWIIIVAEGAGSAVEIARKITDMTSLETRAVVLGHIQRGGRPTAQSRTLALTFSEAAVCQLLSGASDKVVGLRQGAITVVDADEAILPKRLDVDRVYSLIKKLS